MADQIGIVILGCGYWGINYVRVFSELPGARVVAVCDQRIERLQEVARRFPEVYVSTHIDEMLEFDGVDAVVVCTEAKTHFSLTSRCLKAGKHVLVEKPITTTTVEASEVNAVAKSMGLILMVGHTFLYNPGIRKMKDLIDQGEVGRAYYLYARRTNLGPIRRDVNALWDLAPHDISIFNYLLDSTPQWVSAVGSKVLRNHLVDVGFISLGYQDGVVGHIHVSWVEPNKVREVVVVGSSKRIVFDDLNPLERVRVFDKGITSVTPEAANYGEYQFLMRDGDIISPRIEISEPLRNQCLHFLEAIIEGRQPLTTGRNGMEVVQVMEAIDRSLERNGAPIEIAHEEHHEYREVGIADSLC